MLVFLKCLIIMFLYFRKLSVECLNDKDVICRVPTHSDSILCLDSFLKTLESFTHLQHLNISYFQFVSYIHALTHTIFHSASLFLFYLLKCNNLSPHGIRIKWKSLLDLLRKCDVCSTMLIPSQFRWYLRLKYAHFGFFMTNIHNVTIWDIQSL